MVAKFAAFVCLVLAFNGAQASPIGAPLAACENMVPLHGVDAQTTPAPFATNVDVTQVSPGGTVHLTLTSTDATLFFRGFLTEAFDVADPSGTAIGTFTNLSSGRILDCPNGPAPQNAITHRENGDKSSVTVDWTAPAGWTGNVVFKTSFVQQVDIFWVQAESAVVSVA